MSNAADSATVIDEIQATRPHARECCRHSRRPEAMNAISAANRIVAEYEFPYLAHAPMEPLNTTVRFDGDRAEAWAGSQFQTVDQMAIAEVLGLKPEQVTSTPRWRAAALAGAPLSIHTSSVKLQ